MAAGREDLEYWVTVIRLREEGVEVVSAGQTAEEVSGKHAPDEPAFPERSIVWERTWRGVSELCQELGGALTAEASTGAQRA